jgi:hypothetical protein
VRTHRKKPATAQEEERLRVDPEYLHLRGTCASTIDDNAESDSCESECTSTDACGHCPWVWTRLHETVNFVGLCRRTRENFRSSIHVSYLETRASTFPVCGLCQRLVGVRLAPCMALKIRPAKPVLCRLMSVTQHGDSSIGSEIQTSTWPCRHNRSCRHNRVQRHLERSWHPSQCVA